MVSAQQEQQEHDNTSRFLSIIRKYDAIEVIGHSKESLNNSDRRIKRTTRTIGQVPGI